MAKLSVNAMIGLWARSIGGGLQRAQQQQRAGRRGRGLLSGLVYRRLGFEHCMVAKARRILDAPPRYLAQVKTDCLLTQRLPKRFAERLRALEALRHPDGTPVYRVEETKPLRSAPRMETTFFLGKNSPWRGLGDTPMPGRWRCVHPASLRWSLPRRAGWRLWVLNTAASTLILKIRLLSACPFASPLAGRRVGKH